MGDQIIQRCVEGAGQPYSAEATTERQPSMENWRETASQTSAEALIRIHRQDPAALQLGALRRCAASSGAESDLERVHVESYHQDTNEIESNRVSSDPIHRHLVTLQRILNAHGTDFSSIREEVRDDATQRRDSSTGDYINIESRMKSVSG